MASGIKHVQIDIGNNTKLDGQEFTTDELDRFNQSWETMNTFYNEYGEPYQILDKEHKAYLLKCLKVMKSYFKGIEFGGCFPEEGQFGIRWPQVEDLVGATDTEWGATTAGHGDWTAGQYGWLCSTAQGATAWGTAASILLMNSTGSQKWAFVFFGIRSFNYNPVVKDVLIDSGKDQRSVQQVEGKLRMSSLRVALFDRPYFFWPERSFKVGVTVRESDPDQIYPVGFTILTGVRAKDLSYDRPTAV